MLAILRRGSDRTAGPIITDLEYHMRKLRTYPQLPSLIHYAVFSQNGPEVHLWHKAEDGWASKPDVVLGLGAVIAFAEVGAALALSDIYGRAEPKVGDASGWRRDLCRGVCSSAPQRRGTAPKAVEEATGLALPSQSRIGLHSSAESKRWSLPILRDSAPVDGQSKIHRLMRRATIPMVPYPTTFKR